MDIHPYRKPGNKLYDFPSAFCQQGKSSVWLCEDIASLQIFLPWEFKGSVWESDKLILNDCRWFPETADVIFFLWKIRILAAAAGAAIPH